MNDNVYTRASLNHFFDAVLTNNYHDIKEKKQFSYKRNAVKSYIVECHNLKTLNDQNAITKAIHERASFIDRTSIVKDTQEDLLINLNTEQGEFYIDVIGNRYMVFHTASPTKITDPFIKKFYNHTGYDSLWLPVPLLLKTTQLGMFWGMGVNFREHPDDEDTEYADEDETQDLSLSLRKRLAGKFFDTLMKSDLKYMMGISRLSILRNDSNKTPTADDSFIIDDIRYNGKLTAKGNSFERHSRILFDVLRLYDDTLLKLESFGMSFESGLLEGNPFTFTFSRKISPRSLIALIFNAEEPFRLWGIDEEVSENHFRIYAVDLHHGNKGNRLTFEITPSFMRVTIPKGSCGNTLLRLYANLNHHFDAMAKMEVVDYELKVPGKGLS